MELTQFTQLVLAFVCFGTIREPSSSSCSQADYLTRHLYIAQTETACTSLVT